MKAEKAIRSQAREALKGNWVAAVSALIATVVFYLLVFFIFSLAFTIFDISAENGSVKKGGELPYFLILCFTFLLIVAVSPIKNGFLRLCYSIQNGEDADFREVFYFFSGIKLFFKAVQFNIFYALRKLLCYLIAFAPAAVFMTTAEVISRVADTNVMFGDIVSVINVFLFTLGGIIGFLISLQFLPAQFIFAAELDRNVFLANKRTVKGHIGDILKLVISFIPWALLCFFVLPAMYVIPYFFTSAATSTKWLFKLYKEGKTV